MRTVGDSRTGRWLVTGGAGYVGSHVARSLRAAGLDVVVLDDLSSGFAAFVDDGVPLVVGSVTDPAVVAGVLADHPVTGVVHLAGLKYAGVSVDEPLSFYRVNVEGTRVLLEAMVAAGVGLLVFSSSSSVYGTPTVARVDESTPVRPESPYGETKLIGEWLAAAAARAHGLAHTSLRYFNVVGSGHDDRYDASAHNLFPRVFRALQAGERPVVHGTDYDTPDGSCVRDYIHVGDLADGHVAACRRLTEGVAVRSAYNIATGTGASVLEVLDAVRRVTGIDIDPVLGPRRAGDPARIVATGAAARAELAWSPRHDLDAMVATAWRAWQARSLWS